MTPARDARPLSKLRVLLDICDRLDAVHESLDRVRQETTRTSLAVEKSELRRRLKNLLKDAAPRVLAETVFSGRDGASLGQRERLLVVVLLHRRLRESDFHVSGRDLLWPLCDSTYELFRHLRYLLPDGPLVKSGLVTIVTDSEDDPDDHLNHFYMLSPRAYRRVCERQARGANRSGAAPEPYADSTDILIDLNRLATSFQKRAARSFDFGIWRELHGEPTEAIDELTSQTERVHATILARLAATPDSDRLELRRFQKTHGLTMQEMVIVVALLCQEALAGNAVVDAIDLVRLVSSSERELLRKRRLLAPDASLFRLGIVEIEEAYADKSMTGQVYLANWVTQKLLDGNIRTDRKIATDERIEFHNYLSHLDGSDDFFDKLT